MELQTGTSFFDEWTLKRSCRQGPPLCRADFEIVLETYLSSIGALFTNFEILPDERTDGRTNIPSYRGGCPPKKHRKSKFCS